MGTLTVRLVSDPQEVERLAGGWLAEHAVDANVLATILAGELSGEPHYEDQSWALVSDVDRLAGLAVQTPPFYAVVPSIGAPAAEAVAQAWHDDGRPLPGVLGTKESARAFAMCWAELTGVRAQVTMREGATRAEPASSAGQRPGSGSERRRRRSRPARVVVARFPGRGDARRPGPGRSRRRARARPTGRTFSGKITASR